ncbi:type II secretion system F family protein [Nocardioides sp. WL0053]|uniref:Type II secretion system F family protein n=1 Tax=Nocardioides jiangsuensis TaxID=2866161 RepID=A0ABS7RG82_9ACTN|nr:type II secretion system F family protein [Nocardioides jiangsuensis]MBY9073781.1 type II secretion system F family protein [Nocardioides jiangsuensis]
MGATLVLTVGMVGIFTALFVSLAAIGVFTNETRGVSKSLAVVEAFTTAPKSMQDELQPSFNDRVLVPLLNRFVGLGKKLTPADHGERIRHKLDVAGNPPGWTVDRVTSLKFVGFAGALGLSLVACLLLGVGSGPTIAVCVLAALIGYLAPNMYLYQIGYDRTAKLRRALPDALDLLTISVEAGLGFDAALSQVARNTQGPLADEFARVLQEMQIGLGRSKALRALGERTSLPEIRGFVSSMVQADAFGIPIGQVLRVQASEIRVKRRQRAEEQAQKVPVKILLPLVFCILPCLFLIVLGPAVISIIGVFSSGAM